MRFTALTMLISAQSGTVPNLSFVPMENWLQFHWASVVQNLTSVTIQTAHWSDALWNGAKMGQLPPNHWGNVVPVKQCVPRTRLKIKMTSQWRNFSMTSECLKIMNQRKCQTPTFRLNLRTALQ